MTLDEVMRLDGYPLNAAVALKLGWTCNDELPIIWRAPNGMAWEYCPPFSSDWPAAMSLRDWARGLGKEKETEYSRYLMDCLSKRVGYFVAWGIDTVLAIEAIDYARAALLVEE